jgi:general secretion pathway protein J
MRRDAGFTLVELLVTLALMSLLSVIVLGSLRFGIKAWQREATHAEAIDQVRHAATMLRKVIEDAYPYYALGSDGRNRIEFQGTSEYLVMIAPAPLALGGIGRVKVRVFLERRGDQQDLMLSSEPELADGTSPRATTPLIANVKAVAMSYLQGIGSASDATWQKEWMLASRLPQLVRLDITFHDGDARSWPELVVAPRIDVDVGCIYDALTRRCRGR